MLHLDARGHHRHAHLLQGLLAVLVVKTTKNTVVTCGLTFTSLLTYCPSCHRQLGQQQILSISGGLEPVSVRFPMNVPWLWPLPQQYVSMSSLDARVFCVLLVSIRLLLLGWGLDLCVIRVDMRVINFEIFFFRAAAILIL